MSTLKGIDISKHNSGLNFKKLKSAGVEFAMIRAGYGGIVDPKLEALSVTRFGVNDYALLAGINSWVNLKYLECA